MSQEQARQTYKRIKKRSRGGRSAAAVVSRHERMFATPAAERVPASTLLRKMTGMTLADSQSLPGGSLLGIPPGAPVSSEEITALLELAQGGEFEQIRSYVIERLPQFMQNLPHLMSVAAVAEFRLGDTARAETLWQQALLLDPGYAAVHHNLGVLAEQRGDYASACAHYRQALDLPVPFAESRGNLDNLIRRGLVPVQP